MVFFFRKHHICYFLKSLSRAFISLRKEASELMLDGYNFSLNKYVATILESSNKVED
jgi:hypothetical protein